uniref:Uncharacterized protein n=1 Tax=Romanomermis culicivorax TaxID=13658 RepID=A0A915IZ87_ROMCU
MANILMIEPYETYPYLAFSKFINQRVIRNGGHNYRKVQMVFELQVVRPTSSTRSSVIFCQQNTMSNVPNPAKA